MKATRKTLLALVGAMAVGAASAAPSVEITSVQQQYPWTNTVDIVYNVSGVASETNGYFVVFTPTTSTGAAIPDVNGATSVQVALKGSGVYSTQWFPQTNLQYTACKMTPSVFRGAAKDYMIVDLETWEVYYEPMATQADSNKRYNTQEYKTKKLVLRRIPAGDSYYIGDATETGNLFQQPNTRHKVVIPRDYYAAIFDTTQGQWRRVTGDTSVADTARAMPDLSYNTIRANALAAATPVRGFFAILNEKTKMTGWDLPTETMWEVAARAGNLESWASGASATTLAQYAYWPGTASIAVGTLKPNAWGLYDVSGNVWDMCRDVARTADLASYSAQAANGFVPITTGTSSKHPSKGGSYYKTDPQKYLMLSGTWLNHANTSGRAHEGFRTFFVPQD